MLSAPLTARTPAPGDGHTHEARSCAAFNDEIPAAGSDQPLDGTKLIGKTALNVLEPGGRREITDVAEKRFRRSRAYGFKEEVVCLRQLRGGGCIQRLNLGDGHAFSILCNACINIYESQKI